MAHWQDRFLGIGELPPELSIFEIEFFQFSPADIAAFHEPGDEMHVAREPIEPGNDDRAA